METRVVDVARVRALVKRAHMTPLNMRFRPKKVCGLPRRIVSVVVNGRRASEGGIGITYGAGEDLDEAVVGA